MDSGIPNNGGPEIGRGCGDRNCIFPAFTLSAGLLAGSANGTSVGAIAGHVVGGMKRSDLKDLGELLDQGTSGLVVAAATDIGSRVNAAITRAEKSVKAQIQADTDALTAKINRRVKSAGQGP